MTQVDRRSALAIGLAAASAAMVKPAAAQTTNYKDTTVAPGVVNRVYGEGPSIIPGFKTVSLRDIMMSELGQSRRFQPTTDPSGLPSAAESGRRYSDRREVPTRDLG